METQATTQLVRYLKAWAHYIVLCTIYKSTPYHVPVRRRDGVTSDGVPGVQLGIFLPSEDMLLILKLVPGEGFFIQCKNNHLGSWSGRQDLSNCGI